MELESRARPAAGRVRCNADRARALQPARERRQIHAGRNADHDCRLRSPAGEPAGERQRHGPGIPKGQEESIFEKFTRGTRESATPGVGLGLAISRAIVEAHHGKIFCGERPERRARFTFTLPLGTPPGTPDESAVAGAGLSQLSIFMSSIRRVP